MCWDSKSVREGCAVFYPVGLTLNTCMRRAMQLQGQVVEDVQRSNRWWHCVGSSMRAAGTLEMMDCLYCSIPVKASFWVFKDRRPLGRDPYLQLSPLFYLVMSNGNVELLLWNWEKKVMKISPFSPFSNELNPRKLLKEKYQLFRKQIVFVSVPDFSFHSHRKCA